MAVLFTNTTGVLQIAGPSQAERAAFEISIGEHVGQAELGGGGQ